MPKISVLLSSNNDSYSAHMIDSRSGKLLVDKIDARWVQSFTESFCIVIRAHAEKHTLCPSKWKELDGDVALHLGYIYRFLLLDRRTKIK